MKGLEVYKSPENFTVVRLHYTADSDKDPETEQGKIWIAKALEGVKGGMASPLWRKEMEMDFSAFSGQLLCYAIMQKYREKIIKAVEIKPHWNLYGSLDWGRNNPSAFHVYAVDEAKCIYSIYEIYQRDLSIPDFCSLIKQCPHYKNLLWISADPSIWNKNQESKEGLRSLEDYFREQGLILRKSKGRDDALAINELLDRWDKLDLRDARFVISPACNKQIWEFERLRYKEISSTSIDKQNACEQLVDKDNHSYDNFKYFINTWLSPAETPSNEPVASENSLYARLHRDEDKDWRNNFN